MRLSSFRLRKVGPYRRVPWCVPARRLCRSPQDCVCRLRSHGRAPITRTDARKDTHPLTRRYPVTRHMRTHKPAHARAHAGRAALRRSGAREGYRCIFTCRTCRVRVLVAFDDIPPAVCQAFYALGQLRTSRTPAVIQDFYFYIGIFSLSFEFVQPGCDGGSTDFPTRFQSNVRATLGRGLIAATGT